VLSVEFETIPTIPTADELLERALKRAAAAKKEKRNKVRANEEFVRSVSKSLYDKLDDTVHRFPTFENLPVFYRDMTNILFSIDKLRKSLGALTWAANRIRDVGNEYAWKIRSDPDDASNLRKAATGRMASIMHQVEDDLLLLNNARDVLRKLPDIRDEFTVVVAGYPNVGKSSFIRLVSSATPQVAGYAFTTKQVVVGHRDVGRERMQIVDTPGILDRPAEERNYIEHQALAAITNVADIILFIIDASEACGYPVERQLALLEEVRRVVGDVPVEVVVSKSDLAGMEGYMNMSTTTGEGIDEVVALLLRYMEASPRFPPAYIQEENQ